MTTEKNQMQHLHIRSVQGEKLTPEEQELLERWYAEQDQAEQAMIRLPTDADLPMTFKAQVDELLARIATTTLQIKQLTEENEALRKEITLLRLQLTQHVALQPA
jgi:hypothetical protein